MRIQMLATTAALLMLAGPVAAQTAPAAPAGSVAGSAAASPTGTRTIDNDRVSGSVTTVRDAGTTTRTSEITRKSDGATATGTTTRTRTEAGFSTATTRTGFDGDTRSTTYARTRTETGFTETGTATRRDGSVVNLNGSLVRAEGGATRNRTLTDAAGNTIASRNVAAVRDAAGAVTRNITATGPQRALRRAGPPAGARGIPARRGPQS